jgi:hypothetical protein
VAIMTGGENQPGSTSRVLSVIGRNVVAVTGVPKVVSLASPVALSDPYRSVIVG